MIHSWNYITLVNLFVSQKALIESQNSITSYIVLILFLMCFHGFLYFQKQCMDCLRYFCTECVIRRFDRILSCDNCSMLSRRPLIRSQILQMRSKYLRQYLMAKKVSIRGCIGNTLKLNFLILLLIIFIFTFYITKIFVWTLE